MKEKNNFVESVHCFQWQWFVVEWNSAHLTTALKIYLAFVICWILFFFSLSLCWCYCCRCCCCCRSLFSFSHSVWLKNIQQMCVCVCVLYIRFGTKQTEETMSAHTFTPKWKRGLQHWYPTHRALFTNIYTCTSTSTRVRTRFYCDVFDFFSLLFASLFFHMVEYKNIGISMDLYTYILHSLTHTSHHFTSHMKWANDRIFIYLYVEARTIRYDVMRWKIQNKHLRYPKRLNWCCCSGGWMFWDPWTDAIVSVRNMHTIGF